MNKSLLLSISLLCCISSFVFADTFGSGENQFEIDFVTISGDTNPASGIDAGGFNFTGVDHNYRLGTYEITNDQFAKFASNSNVYWTGADVPSNVVTWLEAAQFVNWLNTSKGYQAAYNFSGDTFSVWDVTQTDGTNLYRHKDAHYFLPTEDEWVKAAYWNGTSVQTYATTDGSTPIAGVDTNYNQQYPYDGPWNVGSCSEELNGTYDMMGNVWEWLESPIESGHYTSDDNSDRLVRGGSYNNRFGFLSSSGRGSPGIEDYNVGFRVASVPEPATLLLLGIGAVMIRKRKPQNK